MYLTIYRRNQFDVANFESQGLVRDNLAYIRQNSTLNKQFESVTSTKAISF